MQDITLEIIDKDGIMVGNDFEVDIKVKNISKSQELRTITKLYVQVDSLKYTGEVVGHIAMKEFENIYLGYQDGMYMLTFKHFLKTQMPTRKEYLCIATIHLALNMCISIQFDYDKPFLPGAVVVVIVW